MTSFSRQKPLKSKIQKHAIVGNTKFYYRAKSQLKRLKLKTRLKEIIFWWQLTRRGPQLAYSNLVALSNENAYWFSPTSPRDGQHAVPSSPTRQPCRHAETVPHTYHEKWRAFCSSRNASPLSASLEDGLEFLHDQFASGLSYSALNTARSAMSICKLVVSTGRWSAASRVRDSQVQNCLHKHIHETYVTSDE